MIRDCGMVRTAQQFGPFQPRGTSLPEFTALSVSQQLGKMPGARLYAIIPKDAQGEKECPSRIIIPKTLRSCSESLSHQVNQLAKKCFGPIAGNKRWDAKERAAQLSLTLETSPNPEQVLAAIPFLKTTGMDLKHCHTLCAPLINLTTAPLPEEETAEQHAESPRLSLLLLIATNTAEHSTHTLDAHDSTQLAAKQLDATQQTTQQTTQQDTQQDEPQHSVIGAHLLNSNDPRLIGLAIEANHQSTDLGGFLLAAGIDHIQRAKGGHVNIRLSTDESRTAALTLYQRAGAREVLPETQDCFDLTPEDLLPSPRQFAPRTIELSLPTHSRACHSFLNRYLSSMPKTLIE